MNRPGEHYFVMPPECVREWAEHIRTARVEVLATNADTPAGPHEHPLVLVRFGASSNRPWWVAPLGTAFSLTHRSPPVGLVG